MVTTRAQIDLWLKSPSEHQRLEFKEAKNQFDNTKLYKYCVALANEGGGILLLGVNNKPPRKVVGTQAFRDPVVMSAKLLQC
jgi:ATP-dependent DNA helicase RecG